MAYSSSAKKVILFGGIISTRGMIDTGNGTTSAIYTVSRVHDGEPDLVFLGEKIQTDLEECQDSQILTLA
jgi:hypothetical protein